MYFSIFHTDLHGFSILCNYRFIYTWNLSAYLCKKLLDNIILVIVLFLYLFFENSFIVSCTQKSRKHLSMSIKFKRVLSMMIWLQITEIHIKHKKQRTFFFSFLSFYFCFFGFFETDFPVALKSVLLELAL